MMKKFNKTTILVIILLIIYSILFIANYKSKTIDNTVLANYKNSNTTTLSILYSHNKTDSNNITINDKNTINKLLNYLKPFKLRVYNNELSPSNTIAYNLKFSTDKKDTFNIIIYKNNYIKIHTNNPKTTKIYKIIGNDINLSNIESLL